MKTLINIFIVVALTLPAYSQTSTIKVKKPSKQDEYGAVLFKKNCVACHSETDPSVTGPSLVGLFKRVPNRQWVAYWIKSSNDLIKSGDPYAVKLSQAWAGAQPDFNYLTDKDIDNIMTYIETFRPTKSPK